MTKQTIATLKGYFNTGDTPTEANFADLIDSAKGSPQVLVIDPNGYGDYTTVSAALAAISDNAAGKRYILLINGAIAETGGVTAKDYVDVIGLPGASITMTSTAGHGFTFTNLAACIWRDVTLLRAGTASSATRYTVNVTGTATNQVRFERCQIKNISDGQAYMTAVNVQDTAAPYFEDCFIQSLPGSNHTGFAFYLQGSAAPEVVGSTLIGSPVTGTTSGYGVATTGTPSPIFRNCYIKGGANGKGINLTHTGGMPQFYGCKIEGGDTGTQTYGVYGLAGTTAETVFENCRIRGGNGGASQVHGFVSDSGIQTVSNCHISPGTNGTGHAVHCRTASAPIFTGCMLDVGNNLTSQAIFVGDASAPVFRNCSTNLTRIGGSNVVTATTTFVLSATKVVQLSSLEINVGTQGGAGSTLSIGTTNGGTEILNAVAIATTGLKPTTLGAGALIPHAANATIYVTINAGGGSPSVTIDWYGYLCAATEAVWIELNGSPRFENCSLVSSPLADAVAITAEAVTANTLRFSNCHIEAMRRDGTNKKAINAAAAYNPAPVYNCVLVGGTTNITAAAGTANGTNTEI